MSCYFTYTISVAFAGVAFLFVLAIVAYLRVWRESFFVILALFTMLGAAMGKIAAEKSETPLAEYAGHYVTVIGTVIQDPDVRPEKIYLVLKCQEVQTGMGHEKISGLVRVRIPVGSEQIITDTQEKTKKTGSGGAGSSDDKPTFAYGDVIKVNGLLNVPEPPGNPGAFDYKAYLSRQGIGVELYAREYTDVKGDVRFARLVADVNPVTALALSFKGRLTGVIDTSFSRDKAALLKGIMLGERGMIDRETRDTFVDTGTIHLLCVSGFHVGLVMAVMILFCRLLRLNSRKTLFLTVPVLVFYALMAGLTPSVMRATIMATTFLVAHSLDRDRDWPTTLALAALIILVFNPLALLNPGFQLSFGATWGILYLLPLIDTLTKYIPSWSATPLAVTFAAQLGVLPLVAAHYNTVSPISLLANAVAIPLVTLIMNLGVLAVLAGLLSTQITVFAAPALEALLDLLVYLGNSLSGLPGAVVNVRSPSILIITLWYLVLYGLGKLLSYKELRNIFKTRLYRLYKGREKPLHCLLGLILVICLALAFFWGGPNDNLLVVHFIDVGQGDSTLLEFPGRKTMLIDAGGKVGELDSGRGVGDMVVVPYLKRQGVRKIDLLMITHPHEDHAGGVGAVCKDIKVGMVIVPAGGEGNTGDVSYQGLIKEIEGKGIPVRVVGKGDIINLDRDVYCEVLWPPDSERKTPRIILDNWNNRSLVFHCIYGGTSFLFTGDIEREAQDMTAHGKGNTGVTVLKVPHHGSANFSPEFIKTLHPRAAVVSVGAGNRFNHPSDEMIKALEDIGADIFRTDVDGAVKMKTDGEVLKVTVGKK
ncbi:MAG TPA: DNA internalization-related competence protein ComEC/Rec2 [Clostridia bacterium]|nr:DNA internalization-related competence protein ComEC/Rec2 [Clostridia bacterium]